MEEIKALVERSQTGDLAAYDQLVRRFQDMAYGYAFSQLGDFHLAEDAAQEAFIEAFRALRQIREPEAFPGWFRRIVFSRCQRILRRRQPCAAALDDRLPAREAEPSETMAEAEFRESVLAAIKALPEQQRTVTTLFYIDGYSQEEIAGFLEVPVTTVKSRLHVSRRRLKDRMMSMIEDELQQHVPGEGLRKRVFAELVRDRTSLRDGLGAFPVLDTERLRLREVRPKEDAAAWLAARSDADKEADFKGTSESQLVAEFEGVRSRFYDLKYVIYWAITLKDEDKMIGNVRYWEYMGHPNTPMAFATLQYEVAPDLWGRGLGAEAVRAAGEFGLTHLGFARVQCCISTGDSRRGKELLEAGFTREGQLRSWWYDDAAKQWTDEVMFSLVRGDLG